jgi:phage repressor protein C with HTH and peptisase S24 domain
MNSPSFEDFFNRLCQATDIENQSQLAHMLGVGRAAISLAKQKNAVPWKWVFTLSEAYNLNTTWLASGNGPPTAHPDQVQASWIGVPHAEGVEQKNDRLDLKNGDPRCAFSRQMFSAQTRADLISLEMTGPSMAPEIKDMDLLLVDRNSRQIRPGFIYVLDLCGRLLIRRVDVNLRGLTLVCDNPAFPPMILNAEDTQEVIVLGQVIGFIRKCDHRFRPPAPPDFTTEDNDISFSNSNDDSKPGP